MIVGIYEKIKGEAGQETKTRFIECLERYGIGYVLLSEKYERCDLLAVFGGDGTVLTAVSFALENDTPILAINTGTVGFLTSFERAEFDLAAKTIRDGKLRFSERTVLETSFGGEKSLALNDVVVERTGLSESYAVIAKLEVEIGENPVYSLSSDGVLVATPTGSTAYSLSAGGVILDPDIDSFILTPICSHAFGTRPIVFPDRKEVKVRMLPSSGACVLTIDGKPLYKLSTGDEIVVRKYGKKLRLAERSDGNFYKRLRQKITY